MVLNIAQFTCLKTLITQFSAPKPRFKSNRDNPDTCQPWNPGYGNMDMEKFTKSRVSGLTGVWLSRLSGSGRARLRTLIKSLSWQHPIVLLVPTVHYPQQVPIRTGPRRRHLRRLLHLLKQPISRTGRICWYQSVKPLWVLLQLEITEVTVIDNQNSEACINIQSDHHHQHITTFSFLHNRSPSCRPTSSVRAESFLGQMRFMLPNQ